MEGLLNLIACLIAIVVIGQGMVSGLVFAFSALNPSRAVIDAGCLTWLSLFFLLLVAMGLLALLWSI